MNLDLFLSLVIMAIGISIVAVKRDLIIKLIGIGIMETGVTLSFVVLGYNGTLPPLLTLPIERVDPLPQALVITSIVVGFAVLALSLVFVLYLSSVYHTTDVVKLKKRIEKDER
ncbi:NADH-quinone oxidoreductase subunit K [Mesoaciditoga lauensis]|uniref:NADH-quinone oxidoreductase subunit K n=1 Tax=Mesoaciditoga lauensis TaxID=1495039 RepID=UPI000565EC71|nr:NADH-quinone oxidoreductase subunit K [Mesoaciditoga lauensis]